MKVIFLDIDGENRGLNDPFFVGNILRKMKKDVSLRCWNKNTDSHAKTVSTKKWNRHI